MEHLAILTASTRTPSGHDNIMFTGSLNGLDGSLTPLHIPTEEIRRMLHKTGNSLVWLELDGDPHLLLTLISGDPRATAANRLELHEVEPHEEVTVYTRVDLGPSANAANGALWEVVDPWIKICGPAERVALALKAPLQSEHVLAREVTLLFRTRLVSDPEQVLFRAKAPAALSRSRVSVSVAVEGTEDRSENAFLEAAVKLIRKRLQLCRPCQCQRAHLLVCLNRSIEVGTLDVAEVSACCMKTLAEADAVLTNMGAKRSRPGVTSVVAQR